MGSRSLFPSAVVPPGGSQVLPQTPVPAALNGLIQAISPNALPAAVMQASGPPAPAPGPNSFELMVASYDPDAGVLVVRFKDGPSSPEMELVTDFNDPGLQNGAVVLQLGDSRLSQSVVLQIKPKVKPPKFATIEEAEKWMEENA